MRPAVIGLACVVVLSCGGQSATPSASAIVSASPTPAATPSSGQLWRAVAAPNNAPSGSTWIAIDAFDGKTLIANVARPASSGPATVALNLHGDGGLRVRNLEFGARLAGEGFLVVTPCWSSDFADDNPAGAQEFTPLLGCARAAPRRGTAANLTKDLSAIADAARTLTGARPDKVVVIGHSAGAAAAVIAAALGLHVSSVVSVSGPFGTGTGALSLKARWGTNPTEQADGLAVPLLIVHGTSDERASIDLAKAYVKLLQDKGKPVETLYVDGAPHDLPFTSYWSDDVRTKVVTFLKR